MPKPTDTPPNDSPQPPDNPSLKNEESKEPYNEQKARDQFGDRFINHLKAKQKEFRGDWWQLAFLTKNLQEDINKPEIKDKDRLADWNHWREDQGDTDTNPSYEFIHLEHAELQEAHLENAFLYRAHLEQANLTQAHLQHADLTQAQLEHAELGYAHLEHANLMWSNVMHARLTHVVLDRANVRVPRACCSISTVSSRCASRATHPTRGRC